MDEKTKPTVDEIEKLLSGENTNPIEILPSGEIVEKQSPPTGPEWILTAMNLIEKAFPLDLEFETDARHIWPKRWERLRRQAECQIQTPQQGPIKENKK